MTWQSQLELDTRIDPATCPHREPFGIDGVDRCMSHDGTFVGCMRSICGEPPRCCYEEPDNSEEARARRLEWMRENETTRRD